MGKLKTFFALGFASGDGFDARSPLFKGFVGTGKDISTINFTDRSTVAVFEGAFDFLTWLTMRDLVEPDCAVIILHSVALRRRALTAITEHGFGRVLLFLDHDQAGHDTTAFFHAELGNRNVVDRSGDYAGFKDLNDWRIQRQSGELRAARPRQHSVTIPVTRRRETHDLAAGPTREQLYRVCSSFMEPSRCRNPSKV